MSNDLVLAALPHSVFQWRSSWQRAGSTLALALSALMMIYWTTVASIVTSWSKDPFAHGYVVVPLTLYLIWRRREELRRINPSVGYPAVPAIAVFALVWLAGRMADVAIVQQVSIVSMICGFVWLILGWPAARVLMYPLVCLLFALPVGDRLVPVLQDIAARSAVRLLALSGIPVLLQAHVISIPGSTWKVAEACSGINYLTASLAVGYVYAGTTYRSWLPRIGFLLGAAFVPLLGNGVRVYGTIFLASTAGPGVVAGTKHFLFGWIVFGLMMILLFVTFGRWREAADAISATSTPRSESTSPRARLFCTVLALIIAALAPAYAHSDALLVAAPRRNVTPVVSLPWTIADGNRYSWSPHIESSTAEFLQSYESDQRVVKMFVAYHSGNHTGATLSGADSALVGEPWWITDRDERTISVQGQSFIVRETGVEGPSTSLVVWNWYSVDGQFAKNDYWARLYLARAGFFRRSRESVAIAIATENRPGLPPQAVLQDFLLHVSLPMRALGDPPPASASNLHP